MPEIANHFKISLINQYQSSQSSFGQRASALNESERS